jgi:hypothetical protein
MPSNYPICVKSENPHETAHHVPESPNINVWCGLLHNKVIVTFLCWGHDRRKYLSVLENFFLHLEEDEVRSFQQDGALLHYRNFDHDAFSERFPGNWKGRAGPITWPLRSPDLTPLDLFLWNCVKSGQLGWNQTTNYCSCWNRNAEVCVGWNQS